MLAMGNHNPPKPMHVNWPDRIVRNPGEVSRFHTEVAGMTREPVRKDEKHTSLTLKDGAGNAIPGICDEAVFPDRVQGWLPYVEAFESSITKVTASGGGILKSMSTDYNRTGQRLCLVKDPSGSPLRFREVRPPEIQ